jgi:hypothetical protein
MHIHSLKVSCILVVVGGSEGNQEHGTEARWNLVLA